MKYQEGSSAIAARLPSQAPTDDANSTQNDAAHPCI
jgi:hypothetical protein